LYCKWQLRWFVKFRLNQDEFGDEEKLYLICRNLNINQERYESLSEKEQDQLWDREVWIKENFLQWKSEKDEEEKKKLAESGRYKAYRRYMKSGGPGQITFDAD
jgi:DnaJ homolog subfamily C member 25